MGPSEDQREEHRSHGHRQVEQADWAEVSGLRESTIGGQRDRACYGTWD